MNTLIVIGILLVTLGVVGLIYGGITYTSSKNVMDVGPMHVQVDERRQIPLSPIGGALAVAAGVTLIIVGRRRPVRGSVL